MDDTAVPDVFGGVVARREALDLLRSSVASPVHSYLFLGTPGRGSHAAARAFAAALICDRHGCGSCRNCRLALAGEHPDILSFEPEGAFLLRSDAEEIIRVAARSPVEGDRKILVLTEFHRVREVAPMLLKTIEEPPLSTIFIIVADLVVPELVTISSRCLRVDFEPIGFEALVSLLVARGVDEERAHTVAQSAEGDFERAWLLVNDDRIAARLSFWSQVPFRLDETGATVAVLSEEALFMIEQACAPLHAIHEESLRALDDKAEKYGERGSGRRQLDLKQRRELRRHRAHELRFGLAVLARSYRDDLAQGGSPTAEVLASLEAIQRCAEALVRNPNESLLLQALFLTLSPIARVPQTLNA